MKVIHSRFPWAHPSVLCALILASCATSSDRDLFREADKNHDGKLTLAEVNDMALPRLFDRYDRNHDGQVTLAEARTVENDFVPRDFDERDLDHDGYVTYAEYLKVARSHGGLKRLFDQVDTNHDGVIDPREAEAHVDRLEQQEAAAPR